MKMFSTFLVLLSFLTVLTTTAALVAVSESLPEPKYKTTWPKYAEIKEESVYQYQVMDYKGRLKLELFEDSSDANYDKPEDAITSLFSAVYNGDYDMWLNSWTKDSQEELKGEGISKEDRLGEWESYYKDHYIALINRIETGKYILLYYNVANKKNKIKQRQTMAFVKEDGRWLATTELNEDPVYLYWQNSNYKAYGDGRELISE